MQRDTTNDKKRFTAFVLHTLSATFNASPDKADYTVIDYCYETGKTIYRTAETLAMIQMNEAESK